MRGLLAGIVLWLGVAAAACAPPAAPDLPVMYQRGGYWVAPVLSSSSASTPER